MTKEEFLKNYKIQSNLTEAEWKEFLKTQEVIKCNCEHKQCRGWALITKIKKHNSLVIDD